MLNCLLAFWVFYSRDPQPHWGYRCLGNPEKSHWVPLQSYYHWRWNPSQHGRRQFQNVGKFQTEHLCRMRTGISKWELPTVPKVQLPGFFWNTSSFSWVMESQHFSLCYWKRYLGKEANGHQETHKWAPWHPGHHVKDHCSRMGSPHLFVF